MYGCGLMCFLRCFLRCGGVVCSCSGVLSGWTRALVAVAVRSCPRPPSSGHWPRMRLDEALQALTVLHVRRVMVELYQLYQFLIFHGTWLFNRCDPKITCVCVCVCVCVCKSRSVVSDSLQPHGLYSPWNSPGQNTRIGSCSLLQGIFPTQGLNPGFPHCRWILYQLSHKGSPK